MDAKDLQKSIWQNVTEWFARPASSGDRAKEWLEGITPEHTIAKTSREVVMSIYDLFTAPVVAAANAAGKLTGAAIRLPLAVPAALGWGLSNTITALTVVPAQTIAAGADRLGHEIEQYPSKLFTGEVQKLNNSTRQALQSTLGVDVPPALAS